MSEEKEEFIKIKKTTDHRLFSTMKKAHTAPHQKPSPSKENKLENIKEKDEDNNVAREKITSELLADIAKNAPVNALMLNYYLDELNALDNSLLEKFSPPIKSNNEKEEINVKEEEEGLKKEQDENLKRQREVILVQLRTTIQLLGYAAIKEGKLGRPVQDLLDKIQVCYDKIQILAPKEGLDDKQLNVPAHIDYLALILGFELTDIQNALMNPGIGLVHINKTWEEDTPPFESVRKHIKNKDAVILVNDVLYYAKVNGDAKVNGAIVTKIENNNKYYQSIKDACEKIKEENGEKYQEADFLLKRKIKLLRDENQESNRDAFVKGFGAYSAKIIDMINGKRLFLVGLRSIYGPLAKFLTHNLFHMDKVLASSKEMGKHTARMSWILYIFRPFIHGFMLAYKMWDSSKENEAKFSRFERFKAAWADHGAYLWNDLVWFWVNLATAIWLTSANTKSIFSGKKLDLAGGILTAGTFIIVDAMWGFVNLIANERRYRLDIRAMADAFEALKISEEEEVPEENTPKFKKMVKDFERLIQKSNQDIEDEILNNVRKRYKNQDDPLTADQLAWMQQMLAIALAAKKAHFEYRFERNQHLITIAQGLLNATAMTMMTFSIFPAMLGPIVYIATSILVNVASGVNNVRKTSEKIQNLEDEVKSLKDRKRSLSLGSQPDKAAIQILEYKLGAVEAELIELKAQRSYQKAATLSKVILDVAIIVGIQLALAFAPFGIGIAIAVAVMAIAAIMEWAGEKYIKHKMISFFKEPPPKVEKKKNDEINEENEENKENKIDSNFNSVKN